MVYGSLKFTFTGSGLTTLMTALETVLVTGECTIPDLPFMYADEERTLNLILKIKDHNCFKVSRDEINLSLEREDIQDSLEQFRTRKENTLLFPEWIQAVNLANKKNTYIYVAMEPGQP